MKTESRIVLIVILAIYQMSLFAQTESTAVVSADKLNVFYMGIDNPVTIAVPGVASDKLRVLISNGAIQGSDGKYIVFVRDGKETTIDVSVEVTPGEIQKKGSFRFRIEKLPDPVICLDPENRTKLRFTREEVLNLGGINILPNTPFELDYKIKSFTLVCSFKGDLITYKVKGDRFSKAILERIDQFVPGDRFWIEEIIISVPGGDRTIPGIGIKIIEKPD